MQINCFSLIYSFPVTAILIGWSVVINFIEHISMAHQLCHALFTQLELGIKRYTYWAGGQKYFYSPDLLASPCRMGSCVYAGCTGVVTGFGMEDMANCISVQKNQSGDAQRADTAGHPSSFGGTDGTTAAAPLVYMASSAADLIPGGSNPWHSGWWGTRWEW